MNGYAHNAGKTGGHEVLLSEPGTRPTRASVAGFLARQPDTRRAECEAICSFMQRATGEAPVMWGAAIVGFGRCVHAAATARFANGP